MGLSSVLVSAARVFQRLPRKLLSALVIPLFMFGRRRTVSMGNKVMEFRGFPVRIVHGQLPHKDI